MDVVEAEAAAVVDKPAPRQPAGADHALAAVYREHAGRLAGLARLLLDDPRQAEEVVQEAFARTYAAWSRVKQQDDPLPYVRRVVVNLSRGWLRRRRVARLAPIDRVVDAPSAEHVASERARQQEVAAAVRVLPKRQRECIVLQYYLDCSVAETAATLNISGGSVKQHLSRARAALATSLGEDL